MQGVLLRAAALAFGAALMAACGSEGDEVVEPAPVCTIGISPASRAFEAAGGSGNVAVTAPAGCAWTAAAAAGWIVPAPASGTGNGTVTYQVSENAATQSRAATLTIGGQSHAVTQQGRTVEPCVFALQLANADFNEDGGQGTFAVATGAACGWTTGTDVSWISITSAGSRTGPGSVTYTVARNDSADPRLGVISAAGGTVTVRQSARQQACDYAVAPVDFRPCMSSGTVIVNLSTGPGCEWTASTSAGWLSPNRSSGTGSVSLSVSYSANYDEPRQGILMLRWPTATAGQNVYVRQAGCRYGVSQRDITVAAGGGSASFDVYQQSEPTICGGATQDRCVWTATSDASWITITSTAPVTGDGRVTFAAAANATGAARSGRITVRDQTVTVTQAGR